MKRFINRDEELDFLEKEYSREGSSLVILYGRRRVGKTALAAEFLKGKSGLYFIATEENEAENKTAFREIIAEFTGSKLLKNASSVNWDLIFDVLIDSKSTKKRLMVIDEFQYLGKANSAFPSIFQRIWDTKLKDNFMTFWFKFIFPNLSYIEAGNISLVAKKINANLVDSHIAFVYEDICKEKVWQMGAAGIWGFDFNKVGRWWNNETEIDIVAYDRDGSDIFFVYVPD